MKGRSVLGAWAAVVLLGLSVSVSCGGKATPDTKSGGGASPSGSGAEAAFGGGPSGGAGSGSAEAAAGSASPKGPGAAPEPIDGKLPATPKSPTFARRSECAKSCQHKHVVPDGVKPAADDKAPVFVWEQVIERKAAIVFPAHSGLDLYGFLIEGEVSVMAPDIKDKQKRIWPWIAFRAPGAGVNVFAKEPTRMLLAVVATAPGTSAAAAVDAIVQKPGSVGWAKRSSPVVSVDLSLATDLSWGGGAYHVRLGIEPTPEATPSAALELVYTSKNAPIAEHIHDKEWEILAIVEGDGELVRKVDGKEERIKVAPGVLAAIPPGAPHSWKPAGAGPLLAMQMYSPPGPEQRFKKLAAGTK